MDIERIDVKEGCARVTVHDHVAYFTGHVSAKQEATLYEQTKTVLARYDELFGIYGYKKENILLMTVFIRDISKLDEFQKAWDEWVDKENAPAIVCAEATMGGKGYSLLELAFTVAVD